MSVTEYNYRFRNTEYHCQGYFSIVEYDLPLITDVLYPGYKNAFSPMMLIPISEWNYLSEPGGIPDIIPGSINGFTNQQSIHHTPSHIVATNNKDYSVAIATFFVSDYGTYRFYDTVWYYWTNSDPDNWYPFGLAHRVTKQTLDPMETAYNQLPEYMYLCAAKNNEPGSTYYPYPNQLGVYWYDQLGELQGSVSKDIALIPALIRAGNETDINPDPEPTPIPNDDPYAPGGGSWTGGGTGNFDSSTDDTGIPGLPSLSATSTGFITLFNPSISQMRNLANYMWSDLFDLDTYKKIFADPMNCILGLSIVPVNVPSGGAINVKVGNIDTGISMTTASQQYVEVDCGSVSINEYWGAYLDYEPFTKAEIFLPYIGIHAISIDDIMGKTITIKYHVDILSGACVAYIACNGQVLYSFIGQCASSIPITGNDWTNVINGVMSIAGAVGSMVATGGASAPFALGAIASTAVNSMKPNIEKSGSLSGTGGMLGGQTPYIIMTRPRQALPERQNHFIGYPSYITDFLGNISGYTEVDEIHLTGIQATGAELQEIEQLLKSGVIL